MQKERDELWMIQRELERMAGRRPPVYPVPRRSAVSRDLDALARRMERAMLALDERLRAAGELPPAAPRRRVDPRSCPDCFTNPCSCEVAAVS